MLVRSLALALACTVATASGCAPARGPQVRVLGVDAASGRTHRSEVVFVQVTNPANRPMRLTRLDYVFASQGGTVATGAVPLARDLPAGAAVVVEVPLDALPGTELTLRGKLTAELDQIVKIFTVSAPVNYR